MQAYVNVEVLGPTETGWEPLTQGSYLRMEAIGALRFYSGDLLDAIGDDGNEYRATVAPELLENALCAISSRPLLADVLFVAHYRIVDEDNLEGKYYAYRGRLQDVMPVTVWPEPNWATLTAPLPPAPVKRHEISVHLSLVTYDADENVVDSEQVNADGWLLHESATQDQANEIWGSLATFVEKSLRHANSALVDAALVALDDTGFEPDEEAGLYDDPEVNQLLPGTPY